MKAVPHAQSTHDGWLQPLHDWPQTAIRLLRDTPAIARVVVATVRGSAPREPGTCMLVDPVQIAGTIGGGRLEWEAIAAARELLARQDTPAARVVSFTLGTDLAQCCGGVVELWIERYTRSDLPWFNELTRVTRTPNAMLVSELSGDQVTHRVVRQFRSSHKDGFEHRYDDKAHRMQEPLGERLPHIYVFGAGHVGQAVVRVLASLPVQVCWADSRADALPSPPGTRITATCEADPPALVAKAPPGAHFIVMTHSHALDYSLCRAILARPDTGFAGVIGSKSKAARFRSRLSKDGVAPHDVARLHCPMGVDGIESKQPSVIAVAIAAHVLREIEAHRTAIEAARAVDDCDGDCSSCGRTET